MLGPPPRPKNPRTNPGITNGTSSSHQHRPPVNVNNVDSSTSVSSRTGSGAGRIGHSYRGNRELMPRDDNPSTSQLRQYVSTNEAFRLRKTVGQSAKAIQNRIDYFKVGQQIISSSTVHRVNCVSCQDESSPVRGPMNVPAILPPQREEDKIWRGLEEVRRQAAKIEDGRSRMLEKKLADKTVLQRRQYEFYEKKVTAAERRTELETAKKVSFKRDLQVSPIQ